MKKIIIYTVLFSLSILANSQEWRFGVYVDPQFCWFSPDVKSVEREGTRFSIKGGLEADRYFANNYAITTGISISNAGGIVSYDSTLVLRLRDNDETVAAHSPVKYKVQYISMPLGLKLKSNEIGYLSFYANVGFTGSVRIGSKVEIEDNDISDAAVEEDIRLFNLSYYFGGGVEYSLGGNTAINAGIVYNNGFLDVLDNQHFDSKDVMHILSVRIGVMF
jgi:hypothetical protein